MTMFNHEHRVLTRANINQILDSYLHDIETISLSPSLKGQALLTSIKRETIGCGPYPHVTLFEAANRIMSDLVILHGINWLLKNHTFPFEGYTVEFGNEDKHGFDISAINRKNQRLIGEAFNVAPSFFQGKKSAMLKKLGKENINADFKVIMVNHDAISRSYRPKPKVRVFYVVVDINEGCAKLL